MKSIAPKGKDPINADKVYTPSDLASLIISHFKPSGRILDPCKGTGAFSDQMDCDWAEIDLGVDFFSVSAHYDWIAGNPPWSNFRNFLGHSMKISDNIVFLITTNHWFTKRRQRDMIDKDFGMVEILHLPTPKNNWPQSGFSLSATHIQRGYKGPTNVNNKYLNYKICE